MYLLKIVNTLKERDDLFVYNDDDVNFASIVRSFTKEALDSIIKATLNQDLPLTDKTFRKCAHIVELLTKTVSTRHLSWMTNRFITTKRRFNDESYLYSRPPLHQ